jgi:hypothetical protein
MEERPKPALIIPGDARDLLTLRDLVVGVQSLLGSNGIPPGDAYARIMESSDSQTAVAVALEYVQIAIEP